MLPAKTIAEVITQLDNIINESLVKKSRLGYFACLYRKMTIAVQKGINDKCLQTGQEWKSSM